MFKWLMFAAANPAGAGTGGKAPAAGPDQLIRMLVPFALVFAVFYFVLIRPQQKQQRKHEDMLHNLKGGEQVVAAGGIVGKVLKVRDDVITLEIAKGVRIDALRSSVVRVLKAEELGAGISADNA